MRQEINNFTIKFNVNDTNIRGFLNESFEFTDNVYSYVVYNNKGIITVNSHISQIEEFNTITVPIMITNIISSLHLLSKQGIICYGQPPLDILVEVLQPLLHKLAFEQHLRWSRFNYDDLLQLCSCKLCELYRKGYYIHKAILKRTFENSVYQLLRKEPRNVSFVSSDARIKTSDDTLSIIEVIPDVQQEYEDYDKEENIVLSEILTDQKEVLIDMLGQRQYDQLLREFRTHTISNSTARQLQRIRTKLLKEGYCKDYWNKYFE